MSPSRSNWMAPVEFAVAMSLFVADLYGLIPLSTTPFLLALGWISLRRRGLGWRSVGFARPPAWLKAVLVGTAVGIGMELFSVLVTQPFFARMTGTPPDLSDFRPLVGNLRLLLLLLLVVGPLGAMAEELVFRGYLMNRVAGLGQGTPAAWALSLVVVNAVFGWGHDYQDAAGQIQAGLDGLLLGVLYLAAGRNLIAPIAAHTVSNSLAFVLIYFDRYLGV